MDTQLIASGGIQIAPPVLSEPQLIYLDFDGALTNYRNADLNLTIGLVTVADAGKTAVEIAAVTAELNSRYAGRNVSFVTARPSGGDYSTVFIGQTDAFTAYGEFAGVAESIDAGNLDHADNAFVIIDGGGSAAGIVDIVAHEVEHLAFGLDHGGEGLAKYSYVSTLYVWPPESKSGLFIGDGREYVVLIVTGGGMVYDTTITTGGNFYIDGGFSYNTAVNGGNMWVMNNSIANKTVLTSAMMSIEGTGQATDVTVNNGASVSIDGSQGGAADVKLMPGGWLCGFSNIGSSSVTVEMIRGGTIIGEVSDLNFDGSLILGVGGRMNRTIVGSGATMQVYGGVASGTMIESGGMLRVHYEYIITNDGVTSGGGGSAFDTTVAGWLSCEAGSVMENIKIENGGMMELGPANQLLGDVIVAGQIWGGGSSIDATACRITLALDQRENFDSSFLHSISTLNCGDYTISVAATQKAGDYLLVDGAYNFTPSIKLKSGGQELGQFVWSGSAYNALNIDGRSYSLTRYSEYEYCDQLILNISGGGPRNFEELCVDFGYDWKRYLTEEVLPALIDAYIFTPKISLEVSGISVVAESQYELLVHGKVELDLWGTKFEADFSRDSGNFISLQTDKKYQGIVDGDLKGEFSISDLDLKFLAFDEVKAEIDTITDTYSFGGEVTLKKLNSELTVGASVSWRSGQWDGLKLSADGLRVNLNPAVYFKSISVEVSGISDSADHFTAGGSIGFGIGISVTVPKIDILRIEGGKLEVGEFILSGEYSSNGDWAVSGTFAMLEDAITVTGSMSYDAWNESLTINGQCSLFDLVTLSVTATVTDKVLALEGVATANAPTWFCSLFGRNVNVFKGFAFLKVRDGDTANSYFAYSISIGGYQRGYRYGFDGSTKKLGLSEMQKEFTTNQTGFPAAPAPEKDGASRLGDVGEVTIWNGWEIADGDGQYCFSVEFASRCENYRFSLVNALGEVLYQGVSGDGTAGNIGSGDGLQVRLEEASGERLMFTVANSGAGKLYLDVTAADGGIGLGSEFECARYTAREYPIVWSSGVDYVGGVEVLSSALAIGDGLAADVLHLSSGGRIEAQLAVYAGGTVSGSGAVFSGGSADCGAALLNAGGMVTLGEVEFRGNTAASGGAIYQSGGSMTLAGVIFSGNSAVSGGAIFNASGGIMTLADATLLTAADTICNCGSMTWSGGNTLGGAVDNQGVFSIAGEVDNTGVAIAGGRLEFLVSSRTAADGVMLSDLSLVACNDYWLVVGDGMTGGRYRIAGGAAAFDREITVGNTLGSTLGSLAVADTLEVGDTTYRLDVVDAQLVLTVSTDVELTSLAGSAAGISWAGNREADYVVEYSRDNFATALQIQIRGNALATPTLPAGHWQWRVRAGNADNWNTGPAFDVATGAKAAKFTAITDGTADLFAADPTGHWNGSFAARHTGSVGNWNGTGETVQLSMQNRFDDLFGGGSDVNMLVLTDDNNGDAIFLDDIYTASPVGITGQQARLAAIDEIRAGAGDDIVDLTSLRYQYAGGGLIIRGGEGDDTIWANRGENTLCGDAGDDRLVGGSDADVIAGGGGDDSMHGGGGDDVFCFGSAWGSDTVEQLAGGTVSLWFDGISAGELVAEDIDGDAVFSCDGNRIVVTGRTVADVSLKFGDDGSSRYDAMIALGVFAEESTRRIFEAANPGMLAG